MSVFYLNVFSDEEFGNNFLKIDRDGNGTTLLTKLKTYFTRLSGEKFVFNKANIDILNLTKGTFNSMHSCLIRKNNHWSRLLREKLINHMGGRTLRIDQCLLGAYK